MILIALDDAEYKRSVAWLHFLADTLPLQQRTQLLKFLSELQQGVCQTATAFDGLAFEDFLLELDNHPEPERMKRLLDKARVRGGDQTPF